MGNKLMARHSVAAAVSGYFEKLFGDTTPLQALGMDIALLFFRLNHNIVVTPRPI